MEISVETLCNLGMVVYSVAKQLTKLFQRELLRLVSGQPPINSSINVRLAYLLDRVMDAEVVLHRYSVISAPLSRLNRLKKRIGFWQKACSDTPTTAFSLHCVSCRTVRSNGRDRGLTAPDILLRDTAALPHSVGVCEDGQNGLRAK